MQILCIAGNGKERIPWTICLESTKRPFKVHGVVPCYGQLWVPNCALCPFDLSTLGRMGVFGVLGTYKIALANIKLVGLVYYQWYLLYSICHVGEAAHGDRTPFLTTNAKREQMS